jgi:hypothetical protein
LLNFHFGRLGFGLGGLGQTQVEHPVFELGFDIDSYTTLPGRVKLRMKLP